MKEASGELNMTLITVIAIGVILALFYAFKNRIANAINSKWDSSIGTSYVIPSDYNDVM